MDKKIILKCTCTESVMGHYADCNVHRFHKLKDVCENCGHKYKSHNERTGMCYHIEGNIRCECKKFKLKGRKS